MRPRMRRTRIVSAAIVRAAIVPVLIALATLPLANCSTTRPATAPVVAPSLTACLAVKVYTPDQLESLAAAVRALAPDSPLRGFVVDYARLRDAAKTSCGRR